MGGGVIDSMIENTGRWIGIRTIGRRWGKNLRGCSRLSALITQKIHPSVNFTAQIHLQYASTSQSPSVFCFELFFSYPFQTLSLWLSWNKPWDQGGCSVPLPLPVPLSLLGLGALSADHFSLLFSWMPTLCCTQHSIHTALTWEKTFSQLPWAAFTEGIKTTKPIPRGGFIGILASESQDALSKGGLQKQRADT